MGHTLTQIYIITIKDNSGALVTQEVTVTLVGTNDLPTIVTYGHISASEGGLSTYVANKGKYRRLGGEYRIDAQRLNGHPMPKFLETAKPQCKDYGG